MKEEMLTDASLREFLLGTVDDEQRARIEDLFLTDSATRERVLALEQDLTEEYLEDSLTEADKERFISLYARTDEQRLTLKIIATIKDWAVREASAPPAAAAKVSVWSRFWARLRLTPRFVVPITAVIVIAIVVGVVWLKSEMEQRKRSAVEQELVQLNSPTSLRAVPPGMISFDLTPGSVRSVEPQAELRVPSETHFIELHLFWKRNERYSMYQAEVRRIDDGESFTIPDLQAESNGRYTIRLRLTADVLRRGQYQVILTGIAANGAAGSSEEYAFVIIN